MSPRNPFLLPSSFTTVRAIDKLYCSVDDLGRSTRADQAVTCAYDIDVAVRSPYNIATLEL